MPPALMAPPAERDLTGGNDVAGTGDV